ncbi:Transposase, Mutator family [Corynebacterium belfantii]|nr:Transposase, Mutator family [Corynebacterium belfantii]STC67913.1 transposase-like protein [Corynebacterium diphtheriae]
MNDLVATLGIANLSKSQVSEIAKDLDSMVEDFYTRPLDSGPYYYLSCDALTMKVWEGGRVVTTSALLATGVRQIGVRSECVAQIVGLS